MTASVKLFLKKPSERPQQLIQLVLTYATQETDDPDLRDRAYIYWRLLSTDPEVAKDVVLAEKPVIQDPKFHMDHRLMDTLLQELGSLSAVFHKPASTFVSKTRLAVQRAEDLERNREIGNENEIIDDLESKDSSGKQNSVPATPVPDLLGDLLDLGDEPPTTASEKAPVSGAIDLLGELSIEDSTKPLDENAELPVLLTSEKGKGLIIRGALRKQNGSPEYHMKFENISVAQQIDGLMITMNKNSFGLCPISQKIEIPPGKLVISKSECPSCKDRIVFYRIHVSCVDCSYDGMFSRNCCCAQANRCDA
jgi:AP-1 complex subunit beta-1